MLNDGLLALPCAAARSDEPLALAKKLAASHQKRRQVTWEICPGATFRENWLTKG
jgi:hypothetical protein